MDVPKALRRLAAFNSIALDQAGTPEGDNAAGQMALLMRDEELVIPEGGLETVEVLCKKDGEWSELVAAAASVATHTESHTINAKMRFRGIKVAVDEAVRLYETHSANCKRLMACAALGYAKGAFDPSVWEKMSEMRDAAAPGVSVETEAEEEFENPFGDGPPTDEEARLIGVAAQSGKTERMELWASLRTSVPA